MCRNQCLSFRRTVFGSGENTQCQAKQQYKHQNDTEKKFQCFPDYFHVVTS